MNPLIKAIAITSAIGAAVFLLSPKANAQGLSTSKVDHNVTLGIHVGSVHDHPRMDDGGRWNNANGGLYIRQNEWVVGGFYNSLYKPSLYVAYVYPLGEHFDVAVGAVTGYNWHSRSGRDYPVVPLVSPSVHFPLFDGVEGRVSVLPGIGKGSAWAMHFSIEYYLR